MAFLDRCEAVALYSASVVVPGTGHLFEVVSEHLDDAGSVATDLPHVLAVFRLHDLLCGLPPTAAQSKRWHGCVLDYYGLPKMGYSWVQQALAMVDRFCALAMMRCGLAAPKLCLHERAPR